MRDERERAKGRERSRAKRNCKFLWVDTAGFVHDLMSQPVDPNRTRSLGTFAPLPDHLIVEVLLYLKPRDLLTTQATSHGELR